MLGRFAETVEPEIPLLYRVASRMVLRREDAEDLVGQTLMQAARFWPTFDGRHLRSWLIRIMRNAHLNSLRMPIEIEIPESLASGEDTHARATQRILYNSILDSLDRLPSEFALAVTLCDIEELSYKEAAQALGVPVGTLQSRLFRGRKLLKEMLENPSGQMTQRRPSHVSC